MSIETVTEAHPVAPAPLLRSPGAERMRRHRERRRKGLRCLRIELRETEVDALIRRRLLAVDSRHDNAAVRRALHHFLDHMLQ
jgi:hypothetical protein